MIRVSPFSLINDRKVLVLRPQRNCTELMHVSVYIELRSMPGSLNLCSLGMDNHLK